MSDRDPSDDAECNCHAPAVNRETQTIIEFSNGSRIICLPAGTDGHNIRGYTADYIITDGVLRCCGKCGGRLS